MFARLIIVLNEDTKEAMADSAWIEAMQDELHQFDRLNVWELVDKPFGKMIIKLKWLERTKRIKISLSSCSNCSLEAVSLILLHHAAHTSFPIYQMDVKTAFLNGLKQEPMSIGYDESISKSLMSKGFSKRLRIMPDALDTRKELLEGYNSLGDKLFGRQTSSLLNANCKKALNLLRKGLLVQGEAKTTSKRSVSRQTDHLKMEMEMEIPSSSNVKLMTECTDTTYTCYEVMKDLIKVSKLPQTLISYSSSQVHKMAIKF
ncbi:hypothetical protein Tco_1505691 [Tanacetum coccineum]